MDSSSETCILGGGYTQPPKEAAGNFIVLNKMVFGY